MANIGASRVVPGANDNLSAVAVVVALAHSLREKPPNGVRVLLLSTGSEESFMEGMQGFAKRHFPALDRETNGVRLPRMRRLTGAVRGRGGGDAAHAPLHAPIRASDSPGRASTRASSSPAACARWPPRTA